MVDASSLDPREDEQYKEKLTPLQYEVTRNKATERAFTGEYWNTNEEGVYQCICCGEDLFSSDAKFDSMCGWPSFYAPMVEEQIEEETDNSFGMDSFESGYSGKGGMNVSPLLNNPEGALLSDDPANPSSGTL